MTGCPDHGRIQDHLEGLLEPAERGAWLEHLAGCAACRAESARFERLLVVMAAIPTAEPSPALTERVLARVLPSSARRRWLVRVGWGYAAAFAACVAVVAVLAVQPSARSFLAWVSTEAPSRLLEVVSFFMRATSFAAVSMATSWSLVAGLGSRIGPFVRALGILLSQPIVGLALAMAAGSCVALFLWLKPSSGRRGKGIRHVGMLGI